MVEGNMMIAAGGRTPSRGSGRRDLQGPATATVCGGGDVAAYRSLVGYKTERCIYRCTGNKMKENR